MFLPTEHGSRNPYTTFPSKCSIWFLAGKIILLKRDPQPIISLFYSIFNSLALAIWFLLKHLKKKFLSKGLLTVFFFFFLKSVALSLWIWYSDGGILEHSLCTILTTRGSFDIMKFLFFTKQCQMCLIRPSILHIMNLISTAHPFRVHSPPWINHIHHYLKKLKTPLK